MNDSIVKVNRNECTACGACEFLCPKSAIHMVEDELGCRYPVVDEDACIGCGACLKKCPTENDLISDSIPKAVYAAWNREPSDRKYAASGGIATAMYHYALKHGIKAFGVIYEIKKEARYIEIKDENDISLCRNSKYVFSDITSVLDDIKKYVIKGDRVLVVGLPCQLAAVVSYVGGRKDNLILVDIICHGTCPTTYLNQHISCLEKKKKHKATKLYFRDPKFETDKFVLSLYENNDVFYSQAPNVKDTYQIGYHKALTYRENCYHCKYARLNRIGDITISDFSGLGKCAPINFSKRFVSCVMISSQSGEVFWNELIKESLVESHPRPIKEAVNYESMLRHPSIPHKKRAKFLKEYTASGDFEKAARRALKKDIIKNIVVHYSKVESIKSAVSRCISRKIKRCVKRLVKR